MSDTIYRQDAINVMCNKVCGVDYCGCANDCNEIKGMMELPSAQQWIPCSAPPEKVDSYICTCTDGHRTMVTCVKWQNKLKRWDLTGTRSFWKVLAWMPLPSPWKGENR